jgi:hypothetical protein
MTNSLITPAFVFESAAFVLKKEINVNATASAIIPAVISWADYFCSGFPGEHIPEQIVCAGDIAGDAAFIHEREVAS